MKLLPKTKSQDLKFQIQKIQDFRNIKEIIQTFPLDMKNSSGERFWSGKKLMPKELEYRI